MEIKCCQCGKLVDWNIITADWDYKPIDTFYIYNCCTETLQRYSLSIPLVVDIVDSYLRDNQSELSSLAVKKESSPTTRISPTRLDFPKEDPISDHEEDLNDISVVKEDDKYIDTVTEGTGKQSITVIDKKEKSLRNVSHETIQFIQSNYNYFWSRPKPIPTQISASKPKPPTNIGYIVLKGVLQSMKRPEKKRKRIEYEEADFIQLYPDIDNPTGKDVLPCKEPTHTAPQIKIQGLEVENSKGYRMCKANYGVWLHCWYYCVEILNEVGNCRIGYSGDLQAPCGYDIFSYSWRNIGGLYHNSTQTICETTYKKGDVILIAISLPPENVDNRLLERLWSVDEVNYEPFKSHPLITIPGSKIEFYKNGTFVSRFENLYQGKYYPCVSLYGGCRVKLDFGEQEFFDYKPMKRANELGTWKTIKS